MKKTLIASAVALATLASASAGAQELQLPKVYGNVQLTLAHDDIESDANGDSHSLSMGDTGSTIGFSHEHEIRPGLKAFAKAEFEFLADEQKSGGNGKGGAKGLNRGDQAFIGLQGDFGLVKVGSYDTIYDDAMSDNVYDLFEDVGDNYLTAGTTEGDTITYYSPNYSGLQLAAAVQVNGQADEDHAFMLVASYELDSNTKVAFAFDSADNAPRNGLRGDNVTIVDDADVGSAFGVSIAHKLGDIRVAASYETQSDFGDLLGLSGVLTMGENQFIAAVQYGMPDNNGADDSLVLSLQALHNLSSNMYVYVEADWADNWAFEDGAERKKLVLGATYVF